MTIAKQKAAHIWERDQHDWYVEPFECSLALFGAEDIPGPVWDPACGMGANPMGRSPVRPFGNRIGYRRTDQGYWIPRRLLHAFQSAGL